MAHANGWHRPYLAANGKACDVTFYIRRMLIPALKSVLIKCPNIRKVILCYLYESSLAFFGQFCPHLKIVDIKYLQCNALDVCDFSLSHIYFGEQLQELRVDGFYNMYGFLSDCPNIRTLRIGSANSAFNIPFRSSIINEDMNYLPNLESIDRIVLFHDDYDNRKMKIMNYKYGKTLKSIKITFYDQSTDDLKTCLIELSLFENLQSLDLCIAN